MGQMNQAIVSDLRGMKQESTVPSSPHLSQWAESTAANHVLPYNAESENSMCVTAQCTTL